MGASSKYALNFSASSVADDTSTLRSGRKRMRSLIRPNSTSVCRVRSCASSTIIALYPARSGSLRNSRSSMPSVMNLSRVCCNKAITKNEKEKEKESCSSLLGLGVHATLRHPTMLHAHLHTCTAWVHAATCMGAYSGAYSKTLLRCVPALPHA